MLPEIISAATSVKAMGELIALIHQTKVSKAIEEKAIELNTAILALQSANFNLQAINFTLLSEKHEMQDERNALAKKIVEMEDWKAESQKYHLKEIAAGVFAYALNSAQEHSAPTHLLCPNCYEKREKSPLQKTLGGRYSEYRCPRCGATLNARSFTLGHPASEEIQ